MDEESKAVLDRIGSPTIKTIALQEIETPELIAAKHARNRAEYCWTLTSLTPKLVFDRDPTIIRVTYVDADTFLLNSVQPIFDEFERSRKAVLITEHAYDLDYEQSLERGRYCVQFMTFVREAGEPVRRWWHDRCLEWCFDRVEDGKFGDQKYLDDWPTRFAAEVHVLLQIDAILAPWNAKRFPHSRALVWHFHGLRLLGNNKVLMHSGYSIPEVVDREVYLPYLKELAAVLRILQKRIVQKKKVYEFKPPIAAFVRGLLQLLRNIRKYYVVRVLPD
jgi:hypothetical protein